MLPQYHLYPIFERRWQCVPNLLWSHGTHTAHYLYFRATHIFMEYHLPHKNYMMNKDFLKRISVLKNSKHTFLALKTFDSVARFLVLELKSVAIIQWGGNFWTILASRTSFSLLNSASIELFEFRRMVSITSHSTTELKSFTEGTFLWGSIMNLYCEPCTLF
jgi:hypothetical protein